MALLLDVALEVLLDVVKSAVKKTFACKQSCKRLQEKLEGMIPVLKEVFPPGVELSENRQKPLREFYEALMDGQKMVEECSQVNFCNVLDLFKYAKKIEVLELYIQEFTTTKGWALTYAELHDVRVTTKQGLELTCSELQDVRVSLEAKLQNVELRNEELRAFIKHKLENTEDRMENIEDRMENIEERMEDIFDGILSWLIESARLENGQMDAPLSIPNLPKFRFGLEISVHELKQRLLRKDVSQVAVVGMGGSGKTTLAVAICKDAEVPGHFEKIIYVTVSKSPDILALLGRMWVKIVGGHTPKFCGIEDARIQLREKLCQQPTLVVLDDVWEKYDLDQLTFEGKGLKTLITTRDKRIVPSGCQYEKQLLEVSHAVPLFCVSAFGQESIPEKKDHNLVMEVIKKCEGLPLALQVIGNSLRDQPDHIWDLAKEKLSRGQPISEDHEKSLLGRLATSIDILKEDVRQCFLDMGIFPETTKISADPLLDLLVYVHGLPWQDAYAILIELASRNLVKLVNNQKGTLWNSYDSSCGLSFLQHDVLRELAIYLTDQEPITKKRKSFILQTADSISEMSTKHAGCIFDAEIVSFNTGSMEENDWCKIEFPNAKALILNFSGDECFLPPFMQSMQKLEVLMIFNHNAKRAALKGISVFSSLTQLKVVQLEGITVPPLHEYCHSWQRLQKLSLILCEGFENMTPVHINFPRLFEFTIDHCSNLRELPAIISEMTSLKRLSVTNCHELQNLLDDIDKLSSLERLRLYACPSLKKLPNSIYQLRKLQYLDISLCQCITELPDKLGQLSSLKTLDMRECSKVKQVPPSARDIKSLVRVICDEKIQREWSKVIGSRKVEVAEEYFNVDWV